ncbi:MAG: Ig-like domain-containing protein, partial [Pseudomonadota bacterium]
LTLTSAGGREAAGIVAASGDLNLAVDTIDNFEDLAVGETDTVTITYTISDGNSGTDTATATITINGENDGPVAVDDSFAIGESEVLVDDILGNDSDVDGTDVLEIIGAEGQAVGTLINLTSTGGREAAGIVAASGDLNIAVDTISNFEDLAVGETDTVTITYTISDGNSGTDTATATITINGENDGPVAVDDEFTFAEQEISVGNLLLNDSDVDASDVLQITSANGNAIDPALGGATLFNVLSSDGRNAEIVVTENFGFNVAFNPQEAFQDLAEGETDTVVFSYDITDNNGGTDTATVTITVEGENDGPVAVDDGFTIGESDVLVDDILGNDSDVDGTDVLEIIEAEGQAVGTLINLTSAGGRSAAGIVAPSGALNLAVDTISNFEDLALGETDTLTVSYTISDGNGGTDTATATITINGENDGPVAAGEAFAIGESDFESFDILSNETDVDATDTIEIIEAGGQATGTQIDVTSSSGRLAALIVAPSGMLNLAVDTIGNFEDLALGETDTLTLDYVISDGNGGSDTATTTITVNGENDGPVAVSEAFDITESAFETFDILGNDTDVDATDTLEIIEAEGQAVGTLINLTSAGGRSAAGIVAPSGDLNLAIDTIGNFEDLAEGETDTLTIDYVISDGNGGSDTATTTITVNGENDDPVAGDDAFSVDEGALLVEDLLGNDTDVDATDVLTITTANGNTVDPVTGAVFNVTSAGGREGAAIVASAGVLNVAFDQVGAFETLAEGETDTVTISYEISDGNGGTDTATATITVVGDGPATVSESFTANTPNTGQEVTISLTTDSTTSDGTVNAEIDINFGAELQPQINVVYVVDTSGSTVDSVLDIEKAALQSLTAEFAAQGFAEGSVSISIVPFSNTAAPDFTGDSVSTFVLDVTDDTTSTDVDDINDALDDLTGGGFSNFTDALDATVDVLTTLDPSNTETNIVYFLADGQPNRGGLTEADVAAAAVPLQAIAQVSAFEIGDADAFEFLDAIDNTGGAESVSLASDLSAALLGSPIPEGTVIDADLFIFDDSDVFGTLVQAIEIDVPGDTDDPANPNLVETLLGLELDLTLSGLASDLGDANRASLVVQFDDDGDGIVDLPLFVEVDIFGTA